MGLYRRFNGRGLGDDATEDEEGEEINVLVMDVLRPNAGDWETCCED